MGSIPSIRKAVMEDVSAVARLNFDTWTTSFRGLVPDAWLDARDVNQHIDQFKERFPSVGFGGMFIAELNGSIVGFSDGGVMRNESLLFEAEIYALYVLREHQRKGIGRILFDSVANEAYRNGMRSMAVKTFAGSPYRRFYEKLGKVLPLIACGWKDLTPFITR